MKKGSNKLRDYATEGSPPNDRVQPNDRGPPERAASGGRPAGAGSLEEWQEIVAGQLRCKPCNKALDEQHLGTDAHKSKLERWKQAIELQAEGYKAPELPYLAWVPYEDRRELMCLLCRKSARPNGTWVYDTTTHCGTHENPAGSKEHRRNLQNYPPGHPWYEENVTIARRAFHPESDGPGELATNPRDLPNGGNLGGGHAEAVHAAPADSTATEKAVPHQRPGNAKEPGRDQKKRNKLDKEYRVEEDAKTDSPKLGSSCQGAANWLESKLERPQELPPGWASAQDPEGNTYYYHRKERVPQWEFPEPEDCA